MDWKTWLGILFVPLAAVSAWYLIDRYGPAEPVSIPFSREGNLIKDNPGLEPGVWYLSYEESGAPGLSIPLTFDGESRCGSEDMLTVCNISFLQGERVRIEGEREGEREGEAVHVHTLFYREIPHEEGTLVHLYFYNPERDKDASGNLLCSRQGLVPVERVIPETKTPLTDAITLLLRGEISDEERAQGVTSEFPLQGVSLEKAVIAGGVATLTFKDPQNKTGGGSCRVGILWAQIEATAKQFPTVSRVRFLPEELFQP